MKHYSLSIFIPPDRTKYTLQKWHPQNTRMVKEAIEQKIFTRKKKYFFSFVIIRRFIELVIVPPEKVLFKTCTLTDGF